MLIIYLIFINNKNYDLHNRHFLKYSSFSYFSPFAFFHLSKSWHNFSYNELKRMLNADGDLIEKLILFVHYNKKYQENHNCYYPDLNNGFAYIIENCGWKSIVLEKLCTDIIDKSINIYNNILEKNDTIITKKEKKINKKELKGIKNMSLSKKKSLIKTILHGNHKRIKNTYQITKHYIPKYDYLDGSEEE